MLKRMGGIPNLRYLSLSFIVNGPLVMMNIQNVFIVDRLLEFVFNAARRSFLFVLIVTFLS